MKSFIYDYSHKMRGWLAPRNINFGAIGNRVVTLRFSGSVESPIT